jgi:predicted anti-sigma-YlaC factor YlaD
MVNHAVEAEELQAFLDRELSPARQAEVERHLAECRACAALLEELQRVSTTLQQWQVEPAPASLHPPAIETGKPRLGWWSVRPAVWGLAATAALLLIVVSVSIPNLFRARMAVDHSRTARQEVASKPIEAPSAPATPPSAESYRVAPAPPAASAGAQPDELAKVAQQREADALKVRQPEATVEGALADRAALEPKKEAAPSTMLGRTMAQAPAAPTARDAAAPPAANAVRALSSGVLQLIAYQVSLSIEVKEFADAKAKLEGIVAQAGGYIAEARSAETPNQPQRADLTLRVPAAELGGVLEKLRGLGRVVNEQLSSEEVAEQVVDLDARLRNARATEQRLIRVLNERTGKVADVLEVEREIARTRQEIERMDARRQSLLQRVALATVQVTLLEEFQARLQPAPVGAGTLLWNASVEGYESFIGTLLGLALFFARHGLNLLFWGGLLWLSARLARRAFLRRQRWA